MVTSVALAVYRLALRAYPRQFREDFEADLVQLFTDHSRHGGRRSGAVLARELVDLVPNAVRLRGESPMTRPVLAGIVLAISLLAALAAGAVAVAAVLAGTAAVFLSTRKEPSIDRRLHHRRARPWAVTAGLAFVAGIAIPLADGGELSEPWWAVMALLLLTGIACAVTAGVKTVTPPSPRPSI